MAIDECTQHRTKADRRCPTCLKPLCGRCQTRDGCCSDRCFESRQKFAGARTTVPRSRGIPWGSILFWAAALLVAAVGAEKMGVLPFKLPFKVPF
ncbi:MAG: hypothetical protein AB7N76_35495 [Planctomycetota bacterium]